MAQNCWSWAVEHQDRGQQPLSTRESIQVDFFIIIIILIA